MDDLPRWRNLSALGRALVPFCVGCLIAGISGCRTATAVPVNTVADYRESYPEQAFYVYRAISRVSPLDAEQTAKAAVAAQVSSTLQASLVSMKASTCAQQECRTIHEAIQTISSQTTFDKAEMIRIDGRLSSTAVGEYVAVAYLSRQELAASVGQEFEEIAASFLPATTRILNASSVVDFSAGYRAARELMVQLTGTAVRYESVVGIPVKGWGEARQLWQLVMERRTEWLAELKVQITVDAKAAVRARIQSAFTTAFSDLGVVVESAGPCTDSYTLAVIPEEECRQGAFGPLCRLSMQVQLFRCGEKNPLVSAQISDSAFSGTSTKGKDAASEKALKAVSDNTQKLKDHLTEHLSAIFPLKQ